MSQSEGRTYRYVKRLIDVVASAFGLLITMPIQAVTAVLVFAAYGRPVLFRQLRPGKDAKVFELLKFRTMRHPSEALVTDEQRLTRVGECLRSTSLDELPSLWNVLKGDMSLIGPRPLLVSYLPRYTAQQARRHEVKPGITGLAQAKGRNSLGWDEKFRLDVEYVDNWSCALDLRILVWTIASTAKRDGISQEGQATMAEFLGNGTEMHE